MFKHQPKRLNWMAQIWNFSLCFDASLMFYWDTTSCAGDWGTDSEIKQHKINLDILYLPSVRVGSDPLPRIWWWPLIWKAWCVPMSSWSRWGMFLTTTSHYCQFPDWHLLLLGSSGDCLWHLLFQRWEAEGSMVISKRFFVCFFVFYRLDWTVSTVGSQ